MFLKKLTKIDLTKSVAVKLFVVISAVLVITFFFPAGESIEFDVKVGDVWNSKDLIAPFTFPVLKEKAEYERELEEAERSVKPVFLIDDSVSVKSILNCEEYLKKLWVDFSKSKTNIEPQIDSLIKKYKNYLDSAQVSSLIRVLQNGEFLHLSSEILGTLKSFYKSGIINILKSELGKDTITIRKRNIEENFFKHKFMDINDVEIITARVASSYNNQTENFRNLFSAIIRIFIEPNVIFNSKFTNQNIEAAKSRISKNIDIVAENEKIIARHDRITPSAKRKIDSYKILKSERAGSLNIYAQTIGKIGHIAMIFSLFGIYIYLFRKKIFFNNSKILLISIIFILVSFLAFLTNRIQVDAPIQYLIFVPAASMLLTIIFDSRIGFYGTVAISLVVAGIRGNDYTIALMNIVAGALAVYSVRDIKSRSQIFRSLMFILLGYSFGVISLGLERFIEWDMLGAEMIFILVNSAISPVLTYGLLIFFEKSFKVTTDLTLIELLDYNHPLLQTLQAKAAGTYHHSISLSTLAEAAAKAIGANPVLAKVGAMYHDIGKSVTPNYFVENQKEDKSEHDSLNPIESANYITKHVEEGIELAKKYDLPKEVIDFIPMHHGTTTAQYFLTLAKKTSKKVDEDLFRYPGPKPQTKETGILMLADATESASRTLENPSREDLEKMIDKIIKTRFTEGQLDECDLTLKDLTHIRESFLNIMLGIYHQRISYPSERTVQG